MTDSSAPTDAPAATTPVPVPPPPAKWPEWFHALDVGAAAVALAATFLAASTAARNSPLFLHLAGGRALVKGHHSPGADPFSHAGAAGRPWADTNWLFDLAAYALYSADPAGVALVAVKAAGVAAALGLLFLLRRPGQPLFPWVVAVLLAAVGVSDSVPAASTTASVLFLAATLVLLFRLDWSRPGWRNPLLLGGLFALWANTDGWFLLGPAATLAVWAGGLIDRRFGSPTARPGLGRGLLVGLVACLLNPFVLAAVAKSPAEAAQLVPWEFGLHLPPTINEDVQLGVSLTLKPTSEPILRRVADGDDPNLPALGVLAVLGLVGAGVSRSATSFLLAMLGLAVGLLNLRLVPFAAVLLVPPAGWGLNELAGWVRGGAADEPRVRILAVASGLGRVLALLAGVGVAVAALPGWLHPPRTDPAYGKVYSQRVEWAVEVEPSLARTAAMLKDWPADRKGLAVGPDLANVAAWTAPGVRQFVNTRYGYHRADLPDLLALRVAALGRRPVEGSAPIPTTGADLDEATAACDRQGGGYLVVTTGSPPRRVDDQNAVNGQVPAVYALGLFSGNLWTLWHLDGRSAVIGRGPGGPAFDPVAQAFRPGEPLPAGPVGPFARPPADDAIDQAVAQVLNPLKSPAAEADDALTLASHLNIVRQQAEADHRRRAAPPRGAAAGGLGLLFNIPGGRPPTDAELALPVLVVRAARRAAAATPDRPEPYRALVNAYSLPLAPAAEGPYSPAAGVLGGQSEAEAQQTTASARFLARLPEKTAGRELLFAGLEIASGLADRYEQTGQLDLARDALERTTTLLKRLPSGGGKDDPVAAERKRLEARDETLSGQIQRQQRLAEREQTPARRMTALVQAGLPGKAIALYRATDPTTFGRDLGGLTLLLVQSELRAGRLEDAAADLEALDEGLRTTSGPDVAMLTDQVRAFRGMVARLAGDLRAAAAATPAAAAVPIPPDVAKRLREAPAATAGLAAAAGVTAGLVYQATNEQKSQGLMAAVAVEAARQTDRGLMALLDGDPTEAGRRFDAALTPLGLPLTEFDPPLADRLTRYRALLRTHSGK